MNTINKGRLAELKVEQRSAELNYIVSKPTTEVAYDLILDNGNKLLKAQIKYGNGVSSHSTGAVVVNLRRRKGSTYSKNATYSKEIDVILVYVPKINKILYFDYDVFSGKSNLYIRIDQPKNGQKKRVIFSKDYEW